MLKILLIEDNLHERALLKNIITQITEISIVGETDTAKEAIAITKKLNPDIVFIDVNMPDKSGIETAKEIVSINPKVHIIFATAYEDYALEAFKVYATDYIVKPFNRARIHQTIERIKNDSTKNTNPNTNNKSKLFISSKDKSLIVDIKDIIMITKVGRKTIVHTVNGTISTNENLKDFESKLNSTFLRAHRAFIINAEMVSEITPWGDRTFLVKLSNTKETALMTDKSAKLFKAQYCKN